MLFASTEASSLYLSIDAATASMAFCSVALSALGSLANHRPSFALSLKFTIELFQLYGFRLGSGV